MIVPRRSQPSIFCLLQLKNDVMVQVFFENRRVAVETEPAQVFRVRALSKQESPCFLSARGWSGLGLLRISSGFRLSRSSNVKWRVGNMIKSSLGFIVKR